MAQWIVTGNRYGVLGFVKEAQLGRRKVSLAQKSRCDREQARYPWLSGATGNREGESAPWMKRPTGTLQSNPTKWPTMVRAQEED